MPKLMQHCFKQKSLQHIRECFSNFVCIYLKHRSTRCIKELLIAHRNCLSHFSLTLAEKRLYRMTLTISQGVINYITFPVSAKGLHIPACLKRGEIHNYQSVVESVFVIQTIQAFLNKNSAIIIIPIRVSKQKETIPNKSTITFALNLSASNCVFSASAYWRGNECPHSRVTYT